MLEVGDIVSYKSWSEQKVLEVGVVGRTPTTSDGRHYSHEQEFKISGGRGPGVWLPERLLTFLRKGEADPPQEEIPASPSLSEIFLNLMKEDMRQSITVSETASILGIPSAAAFSLLRRLEGLGLVVRVSTDGPVTFGIKPVP